MRHNRLSVTQFLRQSSNLFKPEILNEVRSWSVKSSPTIQSIRLRTQFMLHHFKLSALNIFFNTRKFSSPVGTAHTSHLPCVVVLTDLIMEGRVYLSPGRHCSDQVSSPAGARLGPGCCRLLLQADWQSSTDKKGKDTDCVTSLHQLFTAYRTRL